jgi:hypothetical protein
MKEVYFTYDYEVFLGSNSGNLDQVLLFPTDEVLKIHDRNNSKCIFFVDTLFILQLEEVDQIGYSKIINQLKNIVLKGHKIFPHLHPHWINAEYLNDLNTWALTDLRNYRFSSISKEKQSELFELSINLIYHIVQNKYTVDSYRAGGWSIQPFSDFRPFFEKYNIINDFSVIPGKNLMSNAHQFDFKIIKEKPYNFDTDINEEIINGQFKEFPISTIQFSKFEKWLDFKLSAIQARIFKIKRSRGSTVNSLVTKEIDYITSNKRIAVSFEELNFLRALKIIWKAKTSSYLQFISHPKMMRSIDFIYMKIILKFI